MSKPKSKEEIAQGMKNIQEAKKLRVFVKDVFYPQLIKSTKSIDDAKFLLSSFSNMVMEQFLSQMKEKKFIELGLEKKLDKASPSYKDYLDLLGLFVDFSVYDTRELIEGMKQEIEANITAELKDRKLDTLKTQFYE